mmetsp:Transcript_2663/g.6365  ORF Transcript_2663/g.6365 Transcript_2663/m.6365 type:complete len:446 (-) Transcript_2663:519-1856(-)
MIESDAEFVGVELADMKMRPLLGGRKNDHGWDFVSIDVKLGSEFVVARGIDPREVKWGRMLLGAKILKHLQLFVSLLLIFRRSVKEGDGTKSSLFAAEVFKGVSFLARDLRERTSRRLADRLAPLCLALGERSSKLVEDPRDLLVGQTALVGIRLNALCCSVLREEDKKLRKFLHLQTFQDILRRVGEQAAGQDALVVKGNRLVESSGIIFLGEQQDARTLSRWLQERVPCRSSDSLHEIWHVLSDKVTHCFNLHAIFLASCSPSEIFMFTLVLHVHAETLSLLCSLLPAHICCLAAVERGYVEAFGRRRKLFDTLWDLASVVEVYQPQVRLVLKHLLREGLSSKRLDKRRKLLSQERVVFLLVCRKSMRCQERLDLFLLDLPFVLHRLTHIFPRDHNKLRRALYPELVGKFLLCRKGLPKPHSSLVLNRQRAEQRRSPFLVREQ